MYKYVLAVKYLDGSEEFWESDSAFEVIEVAGNPSFKSRKEFVFIPKEEVLNISIYKKEVDKQEDTVYDVDDVYDVDTKFDVSDMTLETIDSAPRNGEEFIAVRLGYLPTRAKWVGSEFIPLDDCLADFETQDDYVSKFKTCRNSYEPTHWFKQK